MVDTLRTNLLIYQLQSRIKDTAFVQRRIHEDVELFRHGGIEVRPQFKKTRQDYLEILGMSVGQLREAMDSEDDNPVYDVEVEEIMKRVRPLTRHQLQRLVIEGDITNIEMEHILLGRYASVEEFYEDLDRNVNSLRANSVASSFYDVHDSTPGDNLPGEYDESGFLLPDRHDEETHPKKPATDSPGVDSHGSGSTIIPPVVLRPRSESFSWADDVEEELEAMESRDKSASEILFPSNPPLSEHVPQDTPVCLSDSDASSDFDMDVDYPMGGINSVEPHLYAKSENRETTDAELVASLAEAQSSSIFDLANVAEESKPSIIQAYLKSSRPTDGDEILDIWLEDENMWFWQYEVIFAAKLTLRKFREDFQSARDAYKVAPFADNDY
ncbi:hypothetical protein M434DRAFT_9631 [Hypoxylon sp. CO27-5]|nr:hypothetical protein M434DRAFT_9631 [Hypoxylon sp. CO27-5]